MGNNLNKNEIRIARAVRLYLAVNKNTPKGKRLIKTLRRIHDERKASQESQESSEAPGDKQVYVKEMDAPGVDFPKESEDNQNYLERLRITK